MSSRGLNTRRKRFLIYGALLSISLIALASGSQLEEANKLLSHLLRDIGISGLVGFLLAMTFERLSEYEAKRLAEEEREAITEEFRKVTEEEREAIKKDVFYYVLGYDIPQKIRDEISTQVLKSLYIRENLVMDFGLEVIKAPDTGESYMRTVCKMSYDIKNLTKERQVFRLNPSVDMAPVASLAGETKFISLSASGCENPCSFTEEQLRGMTAENEVEIYLKLDREIIVLPGRVTSVEVKYQTVRFLRRGHLDFVFTTHTCDLDLTVRIHNPDVKIIASAFAENILKKTTKYDESFGYYNWKIDRPLLAYQGINVTWIMKEAASPANPAAPAEKQMAVSGAANIADETVRAQA
ncbi:MAG TPA: hypothetical protein VJZ26_11240 [Blastocatellia bacterium]|nr:hypothetical protein [Blastocatellia bacterium]